MGEGAELRLKVKGDLQDHKTHTEAVSVAVGHQRGEIVAKRHQTLMANIFLLMYLPRLYILKSRTTYFPG